MTKADGYTIKALLEDLKFSALHSGRYPTPYSVEGYDNRDKSTAFRCMGYNRKVRQINALERSLSKPDKPDWEPGRFNQMIGK